MIGRLYLLLERPRDCIHAKGHHLGVKALDLLTEADQEPGGERFDSGGFLLVAHVLNQVAKLLWVADHLLALVLRDLEQGQHDLQVEIEALRSEKIGKLLLSSQEDQDFKRFHHNLTRVFIIEHLLQIVDVRQVHKCVDNLLEKVVCINYEGIFTVEQIAGFVQPQVLPEHLVEVERFASYLVDHTSQFVRVTATQQVRHRLL